MTTKSQDTIAKVAIITTFLAELLLPPLLFVIHVVSVTVPA